MPRFWFNSKTAVTFFNPLLQHVEEKKEKTAVSPSRAQPSIFKASCCNMKKKKEMEAAKIRNKEDE
jgi:hypothetical protein